MTAHTPTQEQPLTPRFPLPTRIRSNADAPLGTERMSRQQLFVLGSCTNGWRAATFFLTDRHGRLRPLVNHPLPSMPGAQDFPTHHSLAHPLPPFVQRPWHHRQRRLLRTPTSHTARERTHWYTFCSLHRLL